MSSSMTVPCPVKVAVTVQAPLRHLCPHRDEVDLGRVTVRWTTDGMTFELHALREYLASSDHVVISHEELTDILRRDLTTPGVANVSIETEWTTAGLGVRCSPS